MKWLRDLFDKAHVQKGLIQISLVFTNNYFNCTTDHGMECKFKLTSFGQTRKYGK